MGLFRSMAARVDATRGTAAIEVRKALAGLFMSGGGITARPGVLPGGSAVFVQGTSGWAYQVNANHYVTTRGGPDGVHLFGNDGAVTVGTTGVGSTVPAAPGAGLSRIDIIWVRQMSATENADTTSEAVFGVASGMPASGSPLPPAIPTGALEIARNTMTSAATSTASSGNSITQAPYTALRGTPLLVGSGAQQAALTSQASAVNPIYTLRVDTNRAYRDVGAGPIPIDGAILARYLPVTLSGALPAAMDVFTPQVITAPLGPVSQYALRVNVSVGIQVPPGLGGLLEVKIDGAVFGADRVTNAGADTCTATLRVDRTIGISDTGGHTVQAVVTNLAGIITVRSDETRFAEISAMRQIGF